MRGTLETVMHALQCLVEELEQDGSLDEPDQLRRRTEALERLEVLLLGNQSLDGAVYRRAEALSSQLEAANLELYRDIRDQIKIGAGPDILLRWAQSGLAHGQGYDYLDELIAGVLQFEEPGTGAPPLDKEMVFYQPTPARHIFDLFSRTALTEQDVLVDLGSGLGQVTLLASICTSARSTGIELEPAYINSARRSAQALKLQNVSFIQQDARTADLSSGTVFYLYTPFTGTILRAVLDSLQQEAASRRIRICTFGPCTPIIAEEQWLKADGALAEDRIAVFYPSIHRFPFC